eukprot:PITA_20365
MLPNSFGDLTRLKRLSLKECRNVTISKDTLGNITTLEFLDLSCCSKVKELPSGIGDLCNLEVLEVGDRLLEVLPSSLGSLNSLKDLRLPQDILLLNNLEFFRIEDCPLGELPFKRETVAALNELDDSNGKCIFGLERLWQFELVRVQIREVTFPEGVCRNLKILLLSDCKELRQIGRLCGIYDCENVKELTILETWTSSLENLYVIRCSKLKTIQALEHLPKLRNLVVHNCDEIEVLPSLQHHRSLRWLDVNQCSKLKIIQGLEHLTKLKILFAGDLAEIEELPALENLWWLGVSGCQVQVHARVGAVQKA